MSTAYATNGNNIAIFHRATSIDQEHLDIIERSIAGLKAEAAAGTPIAHAEIDSLEQQLRELRARLAQR